MVGIVKIIKKLAKFFKVAPDTDHYRFYDVEKPNPTASTKTEYTEEYASPVSSFSTMATVSDNPGTGRVLDTYFYQPVGRKIERLLMRLTAGFPSPSQIQIFIEDRLESSTYLLYNDSLDNTLGRLDVLKDGSTIVNGLKSLVRQAQYVLTSATHCKHRN